VTTTTTSTATKVLHAAVTVLALVVSFNLVSVVGYFIAGPSGSVATYAILQSALGLLVVAFVVRWRTVSGLRRGIPALEWTGVPAALAYLLLPSAWTGSALFWWQLLDAGPVTWLLDLPVWMVAVGLGLLWGSSQQDLEAGPATPYG
jgi:hypothetical protein